MKKIIYKITNSYLDENGEEVITSFSDVEMRCREDELAERLEIVKEQAYNGEYTIEDDGEPEPPHVPTAEELATENRKLKVQMEMAQEQITFLEDCLLEMADEVYS